MNELPDPWAFPGALKSAVVGHHIVEVTGDTITLDNGTRVRFRGTGDCCAYAEASAIVGTLANTEHVITDVTTTSDGNEATWFIMADTHKVLQIEGAWNEGSGYYFFGFHLDVAPAGEDLPRRGY